MDIKKILAGSKFVIFMLILAVIVGILSYRDSKVDIKTIKKVDVKTSSDQEDIQTKMEQISFYFYNPATNVIEQTTNGIESKRTIVEGDYVEQIILKSPFVPKEVKFLSAYRIENGKKEIIIFNSDLRSLKATNETLYNGFVESIKRTISEKFNIQEVVVQIDGDSIL
ncbi:Uncharacterised protein [Sebaldella termitidis]|uniref:GGDEF domain-containing protein n=1 Tax=Sebaldella termitidis (strain ATCC 33386 / NCTC 11300) TaxID=526218 RepID=D1AQ65_SEBTE|nr:hypothetical protein [Sebaldella termitidis]ACZ07643.1 hypothetical protein Sterm_0771 [Sebaldella termitidis ATCC 33386]SUI22940.1 Uncharacterised protein [Sebaldella termitidis]